MRVVVIVAIAALISFLYWQFGDTLTLENLASKEALWRDMQSRHPVLIYGAAFLLYVLVAGLSLPGPVVLSLSYGWYFGFLRAFVLVSFASTAGAMVAFLLGRYLFRDAYLRRFGDRLATFNKSLEKDGPFYLFTLRLLPVIPYFVINGVMGLTPIRATTFWWVSQIGMLPGTAVFIYAGSKVPNLATLSEHGIKAVFSPQQLTQMLIAFGLIAVLPLATRFLLNRYVRTK